MRVVITGGTGLIGRALTKNLVEDGHEVIVLSRSPQAQPDKPGADNVRLVGWDGRTAAGWGQWLEGADAVVNLAGESLADGRWTPERKRRIIDSRVNAGQAVVEAIRQAQVKPRVLLQASAIGYYGLDWQHVYTESDPPGSEGFENQVCQVW
jgi:uncharacterized protein